MSEIGKKFSVVISGTAKLMMLEHVTFLSQLSLPAAENLYESFKKAFDSLSQYPHRCPVFETPYADFMYRRLIVDRYILLFIIDEQEYVVSIEHIWDSRQDNTIL